MMQSVANEIIMLNVVMLNVVMLNVVMLNVVMLNAIMLSVVSLSESVIIIFYDRHYEILVNDCLHGKIFKH